MKYFVIIGHKATTTGDFRLDDIAGGAGRLDILVRCINSAFFLSHDIRRDVELYLICEGGNDPPKTIVLRGNELKYLNPDERSTSSLIRNALMKVVSQDEYIRSSPGIYVSKTSFEQVLKKLSNIGKFIYLKEGGIDCREYIFPDDPIFILGDNHDLAYSEEQQLLTYMPDMVSIGPYSLHADHCIIIAHNEMDRELTQRM